MKLYLISQTENDSYDTYSDAVVCANSEEEAKTIHPGSGWKDNDSWAISPDNVNVKYIGEAAEYLGRGVVCASYHAG